MEILIQIILFLILVIGSAALIYIVFFYHGGIINLIDSLGGGLFNPFYEETDLGPITPINIEYSDDVLSGEDAELIYGTGKKICENKFTEGWWGTIYFEENAGVFTNKKKLMEVGSEWSPQNPNAQACYGKTEDKCGTGEDNICKWYTVAASTDIQPFCGPPPLECKKSCQDTRPNPGGGTPVDPANTEYEFSNKGLSLELNDPKATPSITGDEYCTNGNLGFIEEGGKWVPKCACVNRKYNF